MTKAELIKALEPYPDSMHVVIEGDTWGDGAVLCINARTEHLYYESDSNVFLSESDCYGEDLDLDDDVTGYDVVVLAGWVDHESGVGKTRPKFAP